MNNTQNEPVSVKTKYLIRGPRRLILLALMATPLMADENPDTILSIEQPVMDAVETLDSPTVSHPLVHTQNTATITSQALVVSTSRDAIYRPLGRNLWGISSTISAKKVPTTNFTIVSLCGLVELVSTSESHSSQSSTIAVPVGSVFVPLGIRTTTDMTGGSRALRFDVTSGASNLCSPEEGSTFSFEMQSESTRKSKGSMPWDWSSNHTNTNTTAWSCAVGQRERHTEMPAFAWTDVIPVNCKGTHSSSGKPSVQTPVHSNWFYLPDSAFYLQLDAGSEVFTSKNDFELIELDKPL